MKPALAYSISGVTLLAQWIICSTDVRAAAPVLASNDDVASSRSNDYNYHLLYSITEAFLPLLFQAMKYRLWMALRPLTSPARDLSTLCPTGYEVVLPAVHIVHVASVALSIYFACAHPTPRKAPPPRQILLLGQVVSSVPRTPWLAPQPDNRALQSQPRRQHRDAAADSLR